MDEFAKRGYWGTSLQDIATRAGISKPGLIHHFPNKESLLAAVMDERDEQDRYALGVPDLHKIRGLEVFDVLDELIEINAQRRQLVQLGHMIRTEAAVEGHAAAAAGKRHFNIARQIIQSALHAGIEDGTVRPGIDVDTIALQAVAMMEGLENQWLTSPDEIDIVHAYTTYTQKLRAQLRNT